MVLIGPNGIEYTYALRLTFPSTNNEAEYEALLAGLRIARQMNISNIEVKVDSKLVASQINGSYEANKDYMIKYLAKAKEYAFGFKSFSIENIPRNINQKTNVLSKLASVAFNHLTKEVLVEVLNERSTEGQEIGQYTIESGILFKKGYLVPMLRCVGPLQANYVIREIHMGSCGMHVGPRAVVRKAVRQGYYWPTMHEDAKEEVQKCDSCQIHALMNTAVAHPQANGLVEKANRSLMEGIKTRLGREKARWVDELPNVLWAHRTSIKQSNGETPFSLTYGSEAVIPAEIGIPT
ncbi:reverse transcriptase domain-containing protein, partial [Tanacetum coccineum]